MTSDAEHWVTEIAEVREDDVILRGYKLSELVGKITYTDSLFLVVTGELPSAERREMLDALLVSLVDHGISPSTTIARMLASCGTPIQAAMAGAVLSIADWHGGSGEQLAQTLAKTVTSIAAEGHAGDEAVLQARAGDIVAEYRARGARVEGFGHPQHTAGDPRVDALFGIAERVGVAGPHTRLARHIEGEIERSFGRRVPMNIGGAMAGLLLDLGFPWRAVRGIVIAARSGGLLAHVVEEHAIGGRWRHVAADRVKYIGRPVRDASD